MFIYESTLILRTLPREELAAVLKRAAEYVFNKNGFIRKIHNIGKRTTSMTIHKNNEFIDEAHYFLMEFSTPRNSILPIREDYMRDVDILRYKIYEQQQDTFDHSSCTFHDEMKPPANRPQVLELIATARQVQEIKNRKKMKRNTNLDYFPFQA